MKDWFYCPICGQKLLKTSIFAESKGLYIKCKKCKKEIEINISSKKYDKINTNTF